MDSGDVLVIQTVLYSESLFDHVSNVTFRSRL